MPRDLGIIWVDEYEPMNALKSERELRHLGRYFTIDKDSWDESNEDPDDWDDGDEWDSTNYLYR